MWSTFGDAEKIAAYNPLRRVPTLVLDDSHAGEFVFCVLPMFPWRGGGRDESITERRASVFRTNDGKVLKDFDPVFFGHGFALLSFIS
jgi:hypothetical protein